MKKQFNVASQAELNSNTAAAWTGNFKAAVNSKEAIAARLATLKEVNRAAVKASFFSRLFGG